VSVKLTTRQVGDVTVVDSVGRITRMTPVRTSSSVSASAGLMSTTLKSTFCGRKSSPMPSVMYG